MRQVHIQGLAGREYMDNLANKRRCKETAPDLRFTGEVDRIYLDVPGPLRVRFLQTVLCVELSVG